MFKVLINKMPRKIYFIDSIAHSRPIKNNGLYYAHINLQPYNPCIYRFTVSTLLHTFIKLTKVHQREHESIEKLFYIFIRLLICTWICIYKDLSKNGKWFAWRNKKNSDLFLFNFSKSTRQTIIFDRFKDFNSTIEHQVFMLVLIIFSVFVSWQKVDDLLKLNIFIIREHINKLKHKTCTVYNIICWLKSNKHNRSRHDF